MLAHDDAAGGYYLAVVCFGAQALGVGVTTVVGRTGACNCRISLNIHFTSMFANSNILRTLLSQLIQYGFHTAQQRLSFYVRRTLQRNLQHAFFLIHLIVHGILQLLFQTYKSHLRRSGDPGAYDAFPGRGVTRMALGPETCDFSFMVPV